MGLLVMPLCMGRSSTAATTRTETTQGAAMASRAAEPGTSSGWSWRGVSSMAPKRSDAVVDIMAGVAQ
jgi:hypothetical protein